MPKVKTRVIMKKTESKGKKRGEKKARNPKLVIYLLLAAILTVGGIKAGPTICQFVRTGNSQVVDFQPQFENQGQILFQPQLSGQTAPEPAANPAPVPVEEPAQPQPAPCQFPSNPWAPCGPCGCGWGW